MLKRILLLFFSFWSVTLSAQMFDPTVWGFSKEAVGTDEYLVKFKVLIEDGWYVYSQHVGADEDGIGPVPTSFWFDENADVEFIGNVEEISDHTKSGIDPVWGFEVKKFSHDATFVQKVRVKKNTKLTGYLEFMVCNDERCLAPTTVDFLFDLLLEDGNKIEPEIEAPKDPTGRVEEKQSIEEENVAIEEEEEKVAIEDVNLGTPSATINTIPGMTSTNEGAPMKWQIVTEELGGDTLQVSFFAIIKSNYYTYGQQVYLDDNGEEFIPSTKIIFETLDSNQIIGIADEAGSKIKEKVDPIVGKKYKTYERDFTLSQMLLLKDKSKLINGYIDISVCTNGRCLPANASFSIDLVNNIQNIASDGTGFENPVVENNNGECTPYGDFGCTIASCNKSEESSSGLLAIFLGGLLGGILALFTPCVFPMIPLTVSFFTKGGQNKKEGLYQAAIYGLSIIFIYVVLAVPTLFFENLAADFIYTMATNTWLNLTLFVVFIIFALSFFGLFDISLPSSLANKADSASNVGGIVGIFFMAVTLAIVSFTCTGPILGTVLGNLITSADANKYSFVVAMLGFGLAFAFPFTFFAAFPSYLGNLPKSGGWLNTFKISLGFVEIAFAFKFLSNADTVNQWNILLREVFLGIWIIVGIAWVLYLIKVIRFDGDDPGKPGWGRLSIAGMVLLFVTYLAPGLWGNYLGLISGFPPPMHYSIVKHESRIKPIKNYDDALAVAKAENKLLFIDFTGWSCVNCRRMEENVWVVNKVENILADSMVVASLYVDDRTPLPKEEQHFSEKSNITVRNVGNKWFDFQISNFRNNSQPWYVIVTPEGKIISTPIGYTDDVDEYYEYLTCALNAYKQKKSFAQN